MINLVPRLPFHWLTAWARRVGARLAVLAVLVDLITATCHEILGVSIELETALKAMRAAARASRLPKWWRSFAGFERWCHDGTCGRPKDWRWLLEHWPSGAVGYRPPLLRVGQSMRETAKILVKFGFCTEDYLRCIEKLKAQLIKLTEGAAAILPDGVEHAEIPPRSIGKLNAFAEYQASIPRNCPCTMLIIDDVAPIPEPGAYARIEARRRALAPYFDTGHMRRSVRMGENAGINAESGELTVWIPEPEEAEVTQEPLQGEIVPQSADLELSGPVWGPSPTREFFIQMRAQGKEHRVKGSWRVVITVPAGDIPAEERNDEAAELWCQQIAAEVLAKVSVPGEDPRANVLILATDEAGHIEKFPLVEADEAGTITPAEAAEPASGDEITNSDGTAPDLKNEKNEDGRPDE